ncbi:MAG: CAP domain-containing protein [Thermodesulfobacteriota bacterium]
MRRTPPTDCRAPAAGRCGLCALATPLTVATLALCFAAQVLAADAMLSGRDRRAVLAAHDRAREAVGVPGLVWDERLARVAAGLAESCRFRHDERRDARHRALGGDDVPLGENLSAASPPSAPVEAIHAWIAERRDWDCARNRCRGTCGHYTQVVWSATRRVGCAQAVCPGRSARRGLGDGRWSFLVCSYAPGGNVVGERPLPRERCP